MPPLPRKPRRSRLWLGVAGAAASVLLLGMVGAAFAIEAANRTPREWAMDLARLTQDNQPDLGIVATVSQWLERSDRLHPQQAYQLPMPVITSPAHQPAAGRLVHAGSMADLTNAILDAEPGDIIELAAGQYSYAGAAISPLRGGTADQPITVRAASLGQVEITSEATALFNVDAPFWRFENLVLTGRCGNHSDCEHAIHVVGAGAHTVIRNNRLQDFNAAIKINGEGGMWPDHGLVEGNTLINSFARETDNPITPVDLVAASDWIIRGNVIADFVRASSTGATYGAFAKGAGTGNVFERNVVVCEWKLRGAPGQHIGLSFGGGGTGLEFRRDLGRTGFEQTGGVMRDNLIAGCSDDGIYLNAAGHSLIQHNTLLDTVGIDGRFVLTSADVTDNIVDGVVRTRDGASVTQYGNAATSASLLFLGWHPQRAWFAQPATLNLTWLQPPPEVTDGAGQPDLCGELRQGSRRVGAFDDFAACRGQ